MLYRCISTVIDTHYNSLFWSAFGTRSIPHRSTTRPPTLWNCRHRKEAGGSEGGREGGREGEREGGREGESEEGREEVREGGREGESEEGRKGGREEKRVGGRKGGKEGRRERGGNSWAILKHFWLQVKQDLIKNLNAYSSPFFVAQNIVSGTAFWSEAI